MKDLKIVYQAANKSLAEDGLIKLEELWGKKYPLVIRSWNNNWNRLSTYSAYNLCTSSEEITEVHRDHIHFYLANKAIIHKLTTGEAPDTSQLNERVRKMIEEALVSEGVEEIVKLDKEDTKANIDIFSEKYMAMIDKIKLPNTKILLLQKLLKKAIEEFKQD